MHVNAFPDYLLNLICLSNLLYLSARKCTVSRVSQPRCTVVVMNQAHHKSNLWTWCLEVDSEGAQNGTQLFFFLAVFTHPKTTRIQHKVANKDTVFEFSLGLTSKYQSTQSSSVFPDLTLTEAVSRHES